MGAVRWCVAEGTSGLDLECVRERPEERAGSRVQRYASGRGATSNLSEGSSPQPGEAPQHIRPMSLGGRATHSSAREINEADGAMR